MDVGANLFVGNLDPEVDEKLLYDTFSAFGMILQVLSSNKNRQEMCRCVQKRKISSLKIFSLEEIYGISLI